MSRDHVYEKFTKSTNKEAILTVIDVLILAFVISVLVGCFWGGTWLLMDVYLLPDNYELSSWISFLIGNGIFIPATFFQENIKNIALPWKENQYVKFFIFSRSYSYILAFAAVNQWRGSAYLLMFYTGSSVVSDSVALVVGVVSLCILKTFRSVVIPPLGTATDVHEEYHFSIQTRFCKPEKSIHFLLDTLFAILIINSFVVCFWKGAWLLLELYILPQDTVTAMSISLLVFFGLYAVPLIGQYEVRRIMKTADEKSTILKIIIKYTFYIFCSFLPVLFWQGSVLIQNHLIFNNNLVIGSWLSHIIGFFGLLLLMATNGLIPRGCHLDAVNEYDVMFEVKYATTVLEYYRKCFR